MTFLQGVLSMLGPVLAAISGGLVASAFIEFDSTSTLSGRRRIQLVIFGALGYVLSSGIACTVEATYSGRFFSYLYIAVVVISAIMVICAIVRWSQCSTMNFNKADHKFLERARINS